MFQSSLATLTCLLLLCSSASSHVVVVDIGGGGDFETIAEGIGAAGVGDTVAVAPGTYTGPLNRAFVVEGGRCLLSQGGSDETIIDCEGVDYAFSISQASVHGFTIRRAYGYAVYSYTGVHCHRGTVSDCVFEDSTGNALLIYQTSAVTDCVFSNSGGTAVAIERGDGTTVTNCVFRDGNRTGVSLVDDEYGGGIERDVISNCLFRDCSVSALATAYQSPIVTGCVFTENLATPVGVYSGHPGFSDCTFVSNVSEGGLFELTSSMSADGKCTLSNCVVAFNDCEDIVVRSDGSLNSEFRFYTVCVFGNSCGDSLPSWGQTLTIVNEDPLFCDMASGDHSFCANSPCLGANEPVGLTMGAFADAAGCLACSSAVEATSWGAIKALFR